LSFFDVVDDAFCHSSGDLAEHDFYFAIGDDGGGAFVFGGGFGMPGDEIFAGMVFEVVDYPTDGVAIDVNIGR